MDFAVDRLNEGNWLHLYPEGKVNESRENTRLKWGVGRLISECSVTPIVIPIFHLGMEKVFPNERIIHLPRGFKKVTMVIGNPIPLKETLEELKARNANEEETRLVLTNLVQEALFKLRITAEIYHDRHLAGGPLWKRSQQQKLYQEYDKLILYSYFWWKLISMF